jgi:predicted nucleotidyltransferase
MAEVDVRVIENVRAFLNRLRLAGIHISKAYLFGSYSKGQADRWSDIDVAVVSPQISGNRFEERVRLAEMAIDIDDRIEPLPFTPESFVVDDPLVREILRHGVALI